jgi:ornithine cyclodeaminase
MDDSDILILTGEEVRSLLEGQRHRVLDAVRQAYVAHSNGQSSLPHSSFVRFPGNDANRIIALPGFLGDGFEVAGMKWIASFPGNHERGLARASAVIVLNSCVTGLPEAFMEGSLISAARTAASAAVAAAALLEGRPPRRVGLLGTGPINHEISRYLQAALPGTADFLVYDLHPERAEDFAQALRRDSGAGPARVEVASDAAEVLRCPLISLATTAVRPHLADLSACPPGAVLLHISLRDIEAQAILACDNVVDDADHAVRAATSLHLAEQLTGNRDFIRCTLADILKGDAPPRRDAHSLSVFSPFGLGVLDLALAHLVRDRARDTGAGQILRAFHPLPQPAGTP